MGRAKITEEEYIAIKAKWEAEKDKTTANRLHPFPSAERSALFLD